ncbi:MAG: hypothetical protein NWE83_01420 [Candidatus Bathyarchaeota archaeon]|nr:hypothetical protein [Candidatus Bathyarchaeota archaeon]
MTIPLSFRDIAIWVTVTTIILIITAELVSQKYGEIGIYIARKRLNRITILFILLTVFVNVIVLLYF